MTLSYLILSYTILSSYLSIYLSIYLSPQDTKWKIGPDKTKVMTNNPNGFQRQIKIKGQRLEEVENFKYLGAIISNQGTKPEILSVIAQTTAALSRRNIIWRDKNISLASKAKKKYMCVSGFTLRKNGVGRSDSMFFFS